ncbi:hypothetical protein, partial [Carnobacterium jeotgali]|uniref:hypothetical protein n=1 Tax=Carnobacterium jeotgali TaxID=545534 RepID=UPI001EE16A0A
MRMKLFFRYKIRNSSTEFIHSVELFFINIMALRQIVWLLQLLTNMIDLGMSAHSATLSFFYRATSNPIP